MDRRDFFPLLSGALAALPLLAHAQTRRTPRIGVLWHAGSAEEEGAYFTGLRQGFRDLGYVEGRNVHFEHRFPNELPERFRSHDGRAGGASGRCPDHRRNPDGALCQGRDHLDPGGLHLRPGPGREQIRREPGAAGRNMTGLSQFGADIVLKRLQFSAKSFLACRASPSSSIPTPRSPICTSA